jgi:murein DD-endopeptidase MepM/ murein hydrolase activator NlpD
MGIITSPYGIRWGRFHSGIDIGVPVGTPVFAFQSGRVAFAGYRRRMGYLVILEHEHDIVTCYGHNDRILVAQGQYVSKGQMIARSGSSGYSTGPHVHFEVHEAGCRVDPLLFLRKHTR